MGRQFSEILSDRLYAANISVSPDLLSVFNLLPEDKKNFILKWNFGALASFEDFMQIVDDENVGRFESYVFENDYDVYLIIGMGMRIQLGWDWCPTYQEYDCAKQKWITIRKYPYTLDFNNLIRSGSYIGRAVLCDAVKTMVLSAVCADRFGEWRTPLTRLKDESLHGLHKFLECFYRMVGKLPTECDWDWVYGGGISYSEIRANIKPDIIFRLDTNIGVVISGGLIYVQNLSGYSDSWVMAKIDESTNSDGAVFGTLLHTLTLCGMFLAEASGFTQLLRQWRVVSYLKYDGCELVDLTMYNINRFICESSNKCHMLLEEV